MSRHAIIKRAKIQRGRLLSSGAYQQAVWLRMMEKSLGNMTPWPVSPGSVTFNGVELKRMGINLKGGDLVAGKEYSVNPMTGEVTE